VQGSCDESGDEIEDPNDSLTMRTPFTGLRPEQILESLVSPSEFCSKILRRYHRLSGFWAESEGQNPERDGRQNHRRLWNFASGLCGQKFVDQNPMILISLKSEVVILNQNSEP